MDKLTKILPIHLTTLAFLILILTSCGSSGRRIVYGEIDGPGSVSENSYADYVIDASGSGILNYQWVVEPASSGSFTNENKSSATFNPAEVTADTNVTIKVMMSFDELGPWIVSRVVTITDSNQNPNAAASCDKNEIGHGQSVMFYDQSTDPEGDEDIIKWEWDFSWIEEDGFCCESEERNPVKRYDDPGLYEVMLRVTDCSDICDYLQQPLVIQVAENYAPVITGVTHNRTTSETGNDAEFVQLKVLFEDSLPVDDEHLFHWNCVHGTFDDPKLQTPKWFPPDYPGCCEIIVTVTDQYGLLETGSCHQWVTDLPVLRNDSAPGNIMIPNDFETIYNGSINPANWIFPIDPDDGNVVFMSFWAIWSGSSVQGIPNVLTINEIFELNPDFRHVMINESDEICDVFSFIYNNNYNADYWALDKDASYMSGTKGWCGGANFLPQHILFDRDGRCRWAHAGILVNTDNLENLINELL